MRCCPPQRMRAGDHACLIYSGADELRSVLVPWVAEGLAAGERCLLVLGEDRREKRLRWLREDGIDVEAEVARRSLVVSDMREVYLSRGLFQPQPVLDRLRESVQAARAADFTGLRAAGELVWSARDLPGAHRLEEYERGLTRIAAELGAQVLCLYDAGALPPHRLSSAYRTHPLAMVEGRMRTSALGSRSALEGDVEEAI